MVLAGSVPSAVESVLGEVSVWVMAVTELTVVSAVVVGAFHSYSYVLGGDGTDCCIWTPVLSDGAFEDLVIGSVNVVSVVSSVVIDLNVDSDSVSMTI